jgi:PAS domain S-box-containing protein
MITSPPHSVLIVEDERVIAKDIQQTLRGMGYDAFAIASSAEEAIARVSERCPDLVLMDIRIEGARDGIETARLLSALHDVPVVFLSAHADEATLERAKKVGPYAFLAKPVKPADLRGAIETSVYRQGLDRQLRERERWFATTLESVADAVVTTDMAGIVTYLNPAAAKLMGVRAELATGQPVEQVMQLVDQSPESADKTPLATTLRLGKPMRLASAQLVNLTTGARVSISDTSAPVIVDGKIAGAVMVFHDDTEKRAVARQLEISDRLAALGTMAAGTAHELNNPLAIITSRVENAIDALCRPPDGRESPVQGGIARARGRADGGCTYGSHHRGSAQHRATAEPAGEGLRPRSMHRLGNARHRPRVPQSCSGRTTTRRDTARARGRCTARAGAGELAGQRGACHCARRSRQQYGAHHDAHRRARACRDIRA